MEVTTPLRAITYDVVSNPSHSGARVLNFLSENHSINSIKDILLNESDADNVLFESMDSIIFESEQFCLPGSSKEECSKYLKKLLTEHFNSLKPFALKI